MFYTSFCKPTGNVIDEVVRKGPNTNLSRENEKLPINKIYLGPRFYENSSSLLKFAERYLKKFEKLNPGHCINYDGSKPNFLK